MFFFAVPDPIVAMVSLDPLGNGLLVTHEGGVILRQAGWLQPIGYCRGFQNVRAPDVLPMQPQQRRNVRGEVSDRRDPPDRPGERVTYRDEFGNEERTSVSSHGSMEMNVTEEQAQDCLQEAGGDVDTEFGQCLKRTMLKPDQKELVDCVEENSDDLIAGGACLAKSLDSDVADVASAMEACTVDGEIDYSCIVSSEVDDETAEALKCVSEEDGADRAKVACLARVAFPEASQLLDVVEECRDAGDTIACVAESQLDDDQKAMFDCVASAAEDEIDASCLEAVGVDEDVSKAVATAQKCLADGDSSYAAVATCALGEYGNEDVARAAGCVGEQLQGGSPSYVGMAGCYVAGGLELNPEQQIAVECAVSSGAQPYAFAVCAGGRLTAREVTKCFTDGVGGDGCFGRNNEIVRYYRAIGIDFEDPFNPNGEGVRAWNTIRNDLEHGFGENNDIRRAAEEAGRGLDNVRREVERAPDNIRREAERTIRCIFGC
ncbi:hypothetical protein NKH36_33160 [Mesorhizobium sp. M1312]|uniref:hypothetical protein n=1 Tax=unclassified Mesorhizobium TaxID=325217 RepID=UPI00333C2ED0